MSKKTPQALSGELLRRGQDTSCLDSRIAQNAKAQKTDLQEWIFGRLDVPVSSSILELCAGTGAQSMEFLKRATGGKLVSMDKSPDAIAALTEKAPAESRARLTAFAADMDGIGDTLASRGLSAPAFDLAFCAYGLYYSADATNVLNTLKKWLKPEGRIAIIGPFGPNNSALFSLLREAGVTLDERVIYTSRDFMPHLVLPWAGENFEHCGISTLRNEVMWSNAEDLMRYWRNSTFFDASREAAVQSLLDAHFQKHGVFQDSKWVMMAEMRSLRR